MMNTSELTINTAERPTAAAGNTLTPVSDDPRYRGLYVVTTYDDFFKNGKNGNGNDKGDRVESRD